MEGSARKRVPVRVRVPFALLPSSDGDEDGGGGGGGGAISVGTPFVVFNASRQTLSRHSRATAFRRGGDGADFRTLFPRLDDLCLGLSFWALLVVLVVRPGEGEGARTSNMCMCIEGSVAGVDSHICNWISAGRLAKWGKDGIVMVTFLSWRRKVLAL